MWHHHLPSDFFLYAVRILHPWRVNLQSGLSESHRLSRRGVGKGARYFFRSRRSLCWNVRSNLPYKATSQVSMNGPSTSQHRKLPSILKFIVTDYIRSDIRRGCIGSGQCFLGRDAPKFGPFLACFTYFYYTLLRHVVSCSAAQSVG